MTTIAYKDGQMASDSCWSDIDGYHSTSSTKIVRLSSGALIGDAGDNDARAVYRLLDRVKNFNQMPLALQLAECKLDYSAIIAFPNGEVAMISIEHKERSGWDGMAWKINRGGAAVGSGGPIAIGAMDAGKSAREAVEIACRRDPPSKGPVHVVPLKPVPRPRKG